MAKKKLVQSRDLLSSDGKSQKFWKIELRGSSFKVTFGRVGTAGQSRKKYFDSAEEAMKAFEKLIAEKLSTGYRDKSEKADAARQKTRLKSNGVKESKIASFSGQPENLLTRTRLERLLVNRKGDVEFNCDVDLSHFSSITEDAASILYEHIGKIVKSGLKTFPKGSTQLLQRHFENKRAVKTEGKNNSESHAVDGRAFPRLLRLRDEGVTFLRAVWDGSGDDGCFEHQIYRESLRLNLGIDIDQDVLRLAEEKGVVIDGNLNGSVSILEVDFESGEACFWDAQQAIETERLDEFLMKCNWQNLSSVSAVIELDVNQEHVITQKLKSASVKPEDKRKLFESELEKLFHRLENLEGGDELLNKVYQKCGSSVSLEVDLSSRCFVFSGSGKKLSVKVPERSLSNIRFQIDFLRTSDSTHVKVKKGRK